MFKRRTSRPQIIRSNTVTSADTSDPTLVMASLGGDRDAFCQIVIRYQSLLCSLAYSAVGDLKHSEDIAQETFVEAWKKLDTLHDPVKLKSWLCGILRFKTSHFRRKESNQPVKNADELDDNIGDSSSLSELEDEAISDQQQALLWQTLEQMPENYREPLILFYREQRSVEHVAEELDLSKDTVKQRLSRGRKLLQEAMVTFVEDTLEKSKPGAGFTMAVMAGINLIPPPSQAAVMGAGAVKTGSLFKTAGIVATFAALSGVVSAFFGLRSSLDRSRTELEKRMAKVYTTLFFVFVTIFILTMLGLKYFALNTNSNDAYLAFVSQLLVFSFVVSYLVLVIRMFKHTRNLRAQERIFNSQAFQGEADQLDSKQREYKSRFCIAGIPLLHFRFGLQENRDDAVVGWIAGGDQAYGLLFAWGGVAVAPVSVGIISVGLINVGAVSFGLFSVGTVAIGLIGFGVSTIAYKGYAWLSSLGWDGAFSTGFSIAKEAAIGPVAFAEQVNNQQAAEILELTLVNQGYALMIIAASVLVIVPAVWHSHKVRQRLRKNETED